MTEKYVALFQNIETYSDYRRTCRGADAVHNHPSHPVGNKVPGRLFYGLAEETRTPTFRRRPRNEHDGFRNPNDPAACP